MNVAPHAIPQAVSPPALMNVDCQICWKEAVIGRLVILACFLKTTMSMGVTKSAIDIDEASEASKMLTNWYLPRWPLSSVAVDVDVTLEEVLGSLN